MTIDPIALEVLWSRLLSVTNEQQAALMRTAFSTVVRESQDLACGVFDTAGNMVAQSETGTPGHINAMATCMRHFMAVYPESKLEHGDVLITTTQAELAQLAGSSRESASRFLAVLERAGIITQGRGRLTVHDAEALGRYVY